MRIFPIIILSLIFILSGNLYSQEKVASIVLGEFRAVQNSEEGMNRKIVQKIETILIQENYKVVKVRRGDLNRDLQFSRNSSAQFYISGQYSRSRYGNLELYAQIYSAERSVVVDAFSVSDESLLVEGLELNPREMRKPDEDRMDRFSRRLVLKIRINPRAQEKKSEVAEHLSSKKVKSLENFPIQNSDLSEEANQIFKLMEDIEVVSATKTKVKLNEAPAAVYVITAKQIRERGYRTLSDALHDLPGFDFQHNYGIFPELIHQRGLIGNNNRTNVYIDGVQDNNINENGVLAGTVRFPLMNVDRIEVVSGPASALYGANAFNGIINVITKDGSTSPGSHVEIMHGAYESGFRNPGTSLNFSTRGKSESGDIDYSVSGYYYRTDGPNFGGIGRLNGDNDLENKLCGGACFPDENAVGYYWSPNYNNSHEETYNVTAKFRMDKFRFQTVNWKYHQGQGTFANGNQQIDFSQRGLETGNFDTRNTARLLGIWEGIARPEGFIGSNWDFQNNSFAIGHDHDFTNNLKLDSEVVIRNTSVMSSSKESYPNVVGPGTEFRTGDFTIGENYSRPDYAYQLEEKLFYNPNSYMSTVVGLVARQFVVSKGYGTFERVDINNFAGYIQQSIRFWDKVTVLGGIRHDETSTYGSATNPRASLLYQPIRELTFKALYSTGFREPTPFELFSQTLQRKQNPDLAPETLETKEVGISFQFLQSWIGSLHAYENKITNLILEVRTNDSIPIDGEDPTGGTWNQNQNLGEVNIQGLEFANRVRALDWLEIFGNYTYTNPRYTSLPGTLQTSPSTRGRLGDNPVDDIYGVLFQDITGEENVPSRGGIPNIAPHKWNLGFTIYFSQDISFFISASYVDVRRTIASNPENAISDYAMLKANFRWENFLYKNLYLNVRVNNLGNDLFFDPGIRNASGGYYPTRHPLEKRNIWITLGMKF